MATLPIKLRSTRFWTPASICTAPPLRPRLNTSRLSRHLDPHSIPAGTRGLIYLPRVLSPAFWRQMTPKALRGGGPTDELPVVRKPWNPATYYIWMALLIGSQAIQLITLNKGFIKFTQETDAKLAQLKDVVRRIQNGEDPDVEAILGTGDATKEKEWEQVMRELESEDAMLQSMRKKRKSRNSTGEDSSDEKAKQ